MKILLFGGSGQLGHDISIRADALNFQIVAPIISEVDISNANQVDFLFEQVKPDLVVNCAAYTQVDQAEIERDLAFASNATGAMNIARASRKLGKRLIHISTDYVYDDGGNSPLKENWPTNPLSVYGQSKLAGEKAVLEEHGDKSLILRTAWLHGNYGNNFVKTMLRLFQEKTEIKVVNDQFGSPTWTGWLAEAILDLGRIDASGVMNATCAGVASWYDFTLEIWEQVKDELPVVPGLKILPQSTSECARPAKRPRYSALDCSKLGKVLGRTPISWQEGLRRHVQEVLTDLEKAK